MDIFSMLKKDHQKVKALFKQFEAAEGAKKRKIAEEVFQELEVHTQIEEEIFYPAIEEEAGEKANELVREAFEEHHVVKLLIKELKSLKGDEETFIAKFTVLQENVEHHIEEEENELFPQAKKALKEDIEEISEEAEERKEELLATV